MPYTANLSKSSGRTYFAIEFRHPVKKDRSGRFGLKVRRGLGTADVEEAERLCAELNELLADESYHRASARAAAAARFSDIIVDAFYRDLEPVAESRAADRDRHIPLPTGDDGYSSVLLIGTTASGKSTLVRQFLGTDPATERFPSTAPGRTTIADQEFVIRPDGDFEAVVTLLPQDLIVARVEDAFADAALVHLQGRKSHEVARAMLSPREGRFRLSYVLGSVRSISRGSIDADGDGDEDEEMPSLDSAAPSRATRVPEFVERLIQISTQVGEDVAKARSLAMSEITTVPDRDSVEQDIDMALRDTRSFVELVDDVVDEIELRFAAVSVGQFDRRAGQWPRVWTIRMPSTQRREFLSAIRPFTGINAAQHGSLLTPIVEGVRVAGPFQPKWADRPLRLVLIDGEGVGHNPETLRSLPGNVTDRISQADRILLVDSAPQPMLEGPTLVTRTLERMGESAKLILCFTHVDEMRKAENLPTLGDKAEHVRDAAREVIRHLAREFGRVHLPDLERALNERAFFVAGIQEVVPERARFTRGQLMLMAEALRYAVVEPSDETTPIYDLDNLVIATAAASAEYVETYRALLKLPSQRTLQPAAWQTVKASARYTSQFGFDGYGSFRPAADFGAILGERLAKFLASPVAFDPENCTEEAKEKATARVRQVLVKALDPWIRSLLLTKPQPLWVRAYEHRGAGSTRLRALDIDVLNLAAIPLSSEEGDPDATRFRTEVKQLVIAAIREAGGRVFNHPPAAADAA